MTPYKHLSERHQRVLGRLRAARGEIPETAPTPPNGHADDRRVTALERRVEVVESRLAGLEAAQRELAETVTVAARDAEAATLRLDALERTQRGRQAQATRDFRELREALGAVRERLDTLETLAKAVTQTPRNQTPRKETKAKPAAKPRPRVRKAAEDDGPPPTPEVFGEIENDK